MKIGRLGNVRRTAPGGNPVILFWVGPYRMGIAATALKEIRCNAGLTPQEIGQAAVLSSHEYFGISEGPEGQLLLLRPGNVGLRVDRVERMVEAGAILALPRAFQGPERSWYRGMTVAGDLVIPILNPETVAREAVARSAEVASARARENELSKEAASR